MTNATPAHLVIDAGNTRVKAARFEQGRLIRSAIIGSVDVASLQFLFPDEAPARIAIGSVRALDPAFLSDLRTWAPVTEITGASPAPLRSTYTTPLTLGVDRLANAVGAQRLFPGRAVLAIDAGTCVTYDLVDAQGTYLGGAITPGLRMRAQALHAYSARLPLVEPADEVAVLGSDTLNSLASGVHHGLLFEVGGYMHAFAQHGEAPAVVVTGGDALRIARGVKNGIFAHPSLTLIGLHALLEHDPALHPAGGPGLPGQSG
jgi:type III pantothenate kinase